MKARLVTRARDSRSDGSLVEMVIWQVPVPVPPCTHCFKYSLVYIRDKVRVVGFDNERGKGDHVHLDGQEIPYSFTDFASWSPISMMRSKRGVRHENVDHQC